MMVVIVKILGNPFTSDKFSLGRINFEQIWAREE